jgi:endonuclease/exonuclease/phosphatase family metal-dependent hydrolase
MASPIPRHIANVAGTALGGSDMLCFQTFRATTLRGPAGPIRSRNRGRFSRDTWPAFAPDWTAVARAARGGSFGNLLLSRLPLLPVLHHLLPQPAEPSIKHMQRVAIGAVVEAFAGLLRVVTTHLGYSSTVHRATQIEHMHALQAKVADNEARPPIAAASPYDPVAHPASLVLCGNLNFLPREEESRYPFSSPLIDAWRVSTSRTRRVRACSIAASGRRADTVANIFLQ